MDDEMTYLEALIGSQAKMESPCPTCGKDCYDIPIPLLVTYKNILFCSEECIREFIKKEKENAK